jgi:transcriptional regulator GlxA family with amidase domain
MRVRKIYIAIVILIILGFIFQNGIRSIRSFFYQPQAWTGNSIIKSKVPIFDASKKTVVIVADNTLTEMFDMLAPFYLFNATGKANVYIVAKEKNPILIKKDLFICPQLTFSEADSMHLSADVIVIPALSIRNERQDTSVITWIKRYSTAQTKVITICDGAATGAATGLYDGKSITCHATDFDNIKAHFTKPLWIQNVSVTKEGNLFSTAGVANAVEGSLSVIKELFGSETTNKVATDIYYPHPEIRLTHESVALNGGNKLAVAKKVFLKRNRNIGLLLENGINEFALAGILDIYTRTFPASFQPVIINHSIVQTKYGLSILYTGDTQMKEIDELHVVMPGAFSQSEEALFKNMEIVRYNNLQQQYLIDICLKRIEKQYGRPFKEFVKISLDYN